MAKDIKVRLTFVSDILGTAPNNPQIYEEFIYKKDPESEINTLDDEIETLGADAVIDKGMTVFHKDADGPFLYDYAIRGFIKESIMHLRNAGNPVAKKLTAYKKKIDGLVHVYPNHIHFKGVTNISVAQRPLRAQTMQGERITLSCSEEIAAGAKISFLIKLENDDLEPAVRAALDHGLSVGIGQWRGSGGKGKFYWEEIGEDGKVVYSNEAEYKALAEMEVDW